MANIVVLWPNPCTQAGLMKGNGQNQKRNIIQVQTSTEQSPQVRFVLFCSSINANNKPEKLN